MLEVRNKIFGMYNLLPRIRIFWIFSLKSSLFIFFDLGIS